MAVSFAQRSMSLVRFDHSPRRASVTLALGAFAAIVALAALMAGSAAPAAGRPPDPVIAAAGDIACDPNDEHFNDGQGRAGYCRQKATSDLLAGRRLAAVLPLGDNQYRDGRLKAYRASYQPSWGQVRSISHPVPGNHEYLNPGAPGYFRYYNGEAPTGRAGTDGEGYYSYEIGRWHLIALNSNCGYVSCGAASPQLRWLQDDLATHPRRCVLAYFHHPRFSSGVEVTKTAGVRRIWNTLYAAGVDVILNGHSHDYERFAPQTPNGRFAKNGIREFVVGTGGKNHEGFRHIEPYSERRNSHAFGVLDLTLHPRSYSWRFVAVGPSKFADSGRDECH